ncbi:MAG: hypothetical protein WAZ94_09440 [Phycisphaerales bacterium]
MEQVTDLLKLYPDLRPADVPKDWEPQTAVYVTTEGHKELESVVGPHLVGRLADRAAKGFRDFKGKILRNEGKDDHGIIYGFGSGDTTRICGYFKTEASREYFIVCGAWKGKAGGGNDRPAHADGIVARAMSVRKAGVSGLVEKAIPERKAAQPAESPGETLLRTWAARRPR